LARAQTQNWYSTITVIALYGNGLSMSSSPKISVVMPVYNAGPYLRDAMSSILDQTFRDFEFIIINDGSTDGGAFILNEYERKDIRIKVLHQDNQGMIAALNRGCRLARGQYIARMDADDISDTRRFERQLEYIEQHAEIGILGTGTCNIDKNGRMRTQGRWPTNPKMLKWTHFFGVCVAHPTVLMRREILERVNFYRPDATHGEDVDLWLRASKITEFGNVPEILFKYRIWNDSTSQADSKQRRPMHTELLSSFIKEFLAVEPNMEAVEGLRQTRLGIPPRNLHQILLTASLIRKLYRKFTKANSLTVSERREIASDAAKRLAFLSLHASRLDKVAFISLALQALYLDYRLLSPSSVAKGWERSRQFSNAMANT